MTCDAAEILLCESLRSRNRSLAMVQLWQKISSAPFPPSADEVRITPCCHHVFCADCIVKAVEDAGFCPLDRKGLNCDDLKELDGLSKRIFESVPVVCSRDGCNWEGSLGRFWNHAEDCSYASSVSAMSKVEVAKTLHEVERKHRTFRERVVRTHHYNKAIFLKCCEESERHKNRHILLKQDLEKLETKVTNLEKEKEELTAKLDAWESNWSHRLRKKGRA